MMVWVDDWQMQCCGEPFSLGSQVAWTLGSPNPEWLESVLGADVPLTIDAAEDRHGFIPADTPVTRGTVTRIMALHCRYAARPDNDPPGRYPVPGSGVLTDVESADGWTSNRGDEQFTGYIVQLES